jgi:hypothetical protein
VCAERDAARADAERAAKRVADLEVGRGLYSQIQLTHSAA